MKKGFMGILLATSCLLFTGCSANMKVVETDTKDKLENSMLAPYIEKVSYKAGEKDDDTTPVNIEINVDERFSDLSTMEKYKVMNNTFEKIMESFNSVSCGGNNSCRYQKLKLFYGDDTYVMDIFDDILIINDFEKYTKSDYKSDVNTEKEKKEREYANKDNTLKSNSTSKNNGQYASNGIRYTVIFDFMKQQYNRLTNNDENYIPEIHDPQVAEIAAKRFGITAKEAGYIYEKVQMDAFN
ncbi:hypothetical protein ACQGSX_18275 [Bacillus sp. GMs2/1]|nr:hypothetical protein [Bacillus cereus]MCM3201777.1 hypothetical protein [Bacillus cereus]MDN4100317.1 hypothetical protein [Bacillus cereus]OJE15242.1 hypothetical protein A9488_08015 [Bacillus cereus]